MNHRIIACKKEMSIFLQYTYTIRQPKFPNMTSIPTSSIETIHIPIINNTATPHNQTKPKKHPLPRDETHQSIVIPLPKRKVKSSPIILHCHPRPSPLQKATSPHLSPTRSSAPSFSLLPLSHLLEKGQKTSIPSTAPQNPKRIKRKQKEILKKSM